jgi:hypothetical protein
LAKACATGPRLGQLAKALLQEFAVRDGHGATVAESSRGALYRLAAPRPAWRRELCSARARLRSRRT